MHKWSGRAGANPVGDTCIAILPARRVGDRPLAPRTVPVRRLALRARADARLLRLVAGWAANDTTFFRPLLDATAANFAISEVSADKGYLSRANASAVEKVGAVPYIPFKSNSLIPTEDSAWARMYHLFAFDRERFLAHYHKRSNVETVFSMVKNKFGDAVLSKSDVGQQNEVLAKVVAHNVCVLIGAIHELGIDPRFGAGSALAQEVVA